MKKVSLLLMLFCVYNSFSQEDSVEVEIDWIEASMLKVDFVGILITNDYELAEKISLEAADSLRMDFHENLLHNEYYDIPNTDTCGCGNVHGYIPRGRYDSGDYISIEDAGSYGLDPDYYVVIVGSFRDEPEAIANSKKKANEFYPGTFVFSDKISHGCMH